MEKYGHGDIILMEKYGINSSTASFTLPQKMDIQNVTHIVAAGSSAAAIKNDETLWMWGYNGYGQLSTGNKTSQKIPVQAKMNVDETVKDIVKVGSTGLSFSILTRDRKSICSWK